MISRLYNENMCFPSHLLFYEHQIYANRYAGMLMPHNTK